MIGCLISRLDKWSLRSTGIFRVVGRRVCSKYGAAGRSARRSSNGKFAGASSADLGRIRDESGTNPGRSCVWSEANGIQNHAAVVCFGWNRIEWKPFRWRNSSAEFETGIGWWKPHISPLSARSARSVRSARSQLIGTGRIDLNQTVEMFSFVFFSSFPANL